MQCQLHSIIYNNYLRMALRMAHIPWRNAARAQIYLRIYVSMWAAKQTLCTAGHA